LWLLGYPEQVLRRSRDNLIRARELARPISLVHTLSAVAALHRFRREGRLAQEQAEAAMALATEHGLPFFAAWRTPGCACWTKRWRRCPRRGCGSTRRSCTGSPGCCCGRRVGRRAAMSLSRLWQQQGRRDEACALLAPVYGWFTEGVTPPTC